MSKVDGDGGCRVIWVRQISSSLLLCERVYAIVKSNVAHLCTVCIRFRLTFRTSKFVCAKLNSLPYSLARSIAILVVIRLCRTELKLYIYLNTYIVHNI